MISGIELLTKYITRLNPVLLKDFQEWSFLPGMGFQDDRTWWGGQRKRSTLHEGIDFYQYRTRSGKIRCLPIGLSIPSLLDGDIVYIHKDFLGSSVYVRHATDSRAETSLHVVFGHIKPVNLLSLDRRVLAGEVLGFLEPPVINNSSVPMHLHMSLAWIQNTVLPDRLS